MSLRRGGSVVALLGGLLWVGAAASGWGGDADPTLYVLGLGLAALALAVVGYALVGTAPVWLRAIVTVATPALGYMVWVTLLDAFTTTHLPVLAGGLVLLACGGLGFVRTGEPRPAVVRGRRAAR